LEKCQENSFSFFPGKRYVFQKKCVSGKSYVLLWYIHSKNFKAPTFVGFEIFTKMF